MADYTGMGLFATRSTDGKKILVHSNFGADQEIYGDLYLSDEMMEQISDELGDGAYTLSIEEV